MTTPERIRAGWNTIVRALVRPYPVTAPMIVLVLLVPFYIAIAQIVRTRPLHTPAMALDDFIALRPAWALVYGSLYLFLIALPVFAIRQPGHLRGTVFAYLTVWSISFASFLLYPTMASRPVSIAGEGFAAWGLRFLYAADPPYNCFPSLHVAHSCVSAFACYRLHRGLGVTAMGCAALVGVSTLFTKQHYVADVIAGALLSVAAYAVFLRPQSIGPVPDADRESAPVVALAVAGVVGIAFGGYYVAYLLGVQP